MALVVGTDTYISLVDADTYLSGYHLSTDADMVLWAALSDAQCEVLLRRAAKIIDRQPLIGLRSTTTQTMEFPRVLYTSYRSMSNTARSWDGENAYVQDVVPDDVKYAQCEIALSLTTGTPERVKMQNEGVRSFSAGNLSEAYSGGIRDYICSEAKIMLSPYLAGGVQIV